MITYLLVSGITTGCIYALIALSVVLLFRTTSVINFSQGEQVMFGGYVLYAMVVTLSTNYAVSAALVITAAAGLGVLTYFVAYGRLYHRGMMAVFLGTLGLAFILKGAARYLFGGQGDYLAVPPSLPPQPVSIADVYVLPQQLLVIAVTVVVMVAFSLLFTRTGLGRWMQAVSENERAAKLVGIPVALVNLITFALSAAMCGLAAVLIIPLTLLYPDMGFLLFIKGFAAGVLGGLNSFKGAVVGGLLIGVIEQMGAAYIFTGLQDVSAFIVLMAALIFMPSGLFGTMQFRRV